MLIYIIAMWAICAPMGYLAGDVFAETLGKEAGVDPDLTKWLGALLPPAAAVMALLVIMNGEIAVKKGDDA